MKLLLDENLSHRLAAILSNDYPGSAHLRDIGMRGASDRRVWDYARNGGFTIVSKDSDFRERCLIDGFPPKVIWLDVGNVGTRAIADLLQSERPRAEAFQESEGASLLTLPMEESTL